MTLTVSEVAKKLNKSEETIRRWIRSGKLKATIKDKKHGWVIEESDLPIPKESKKKKKGFVIWVPEDCKLFALTGGIAITTKDDSYKSVAFVNFKQNDIEDCNEYIINLNGTMTKLKGKGVSDDGR